MKLRKFEGWRLVGMLVRIAISGYEYGNWRFASVSARIVTSGCEAVEVSRLETYRYYVGLYCHEWV